MQGEVNWGGNFPVFEPEDYDMSFPNLPYAIGIKSTFPEELIRRIMAGAISFQAGNAGIDYTYKRYLKSKKYRTGDGSRLDLRISAAINACGNELSALLYRITTEDNKQLGNMICEWTIMRVPHSLRELTSLAHRGNLYESCAVARMILEQLAWASAIDNLMDAEGIERIRAERSISEFKKTLSFAGELYGWLSSHTHWRYDGHIKSMDFANEGMLTVLRSSHFKAISLTVALLLLASTIRVTQLLRARYISSLLQLPPEDKIEASRTLGGPRSAVDKVFGPTPGPSVRKIASLLTLTLPLDLIGEVAATSCGDKDIILLRNMADNLRNSAAPA